MRSVLVALLVTIGITAAKADDLLYSFGFSQRTPGDTIISTLTGTIITNGTIGVLTPDDIVTWTVTDVETTIIPSGERGFTQTGSGGSWTPGSVTTTAGGQIIFDYGSDFMNVASIADVWYLGSGCVFAPFGCHAERDIPDARRFEDGDQIQIFAGGGLAAPAEAVPAPILGAGLPGLILAGLGLLWRRKRTSAP